MTSDFSQETKESRRLGNNTFQRLKRRRKLSTHNSIFGKISLKKKCEIKISVHEKHTKNMLLGELSYKECFFRLREIIPGENLHLQERMKSLRNNKYLVNTHMTFHLFYMHLIT